MLKRPKTEEGEGQRKGDKGELGPRGLALQ